MVSRPGGGCLMVPRRVRGWKADSRVWLVSGCSGSQSGLDRQAVLWCEEWAFPGRPGQWVGIWCGWMAVTEPFCAPFALSCQCCELTGCVGSL